MCCHFLWSAVGQWERTNENEEQSEEDGAREKTDAAVAGFSLTVINGQGTETQQH